MRINNNEPSFKAVTITPRAMEVLSERMPSGKFIIGIDNFKDKYQNSPINLKIDILDKFKPRLDASISYKKGGKENFAHLTENFVSYILSLNPEKFIIKAGKELEKIEKELKLI